MAEEVNESKTVDMALSLLAVPFVVGLAGARSLQEGLISIGEASEEIFRRDRLPILYYWSSESTDDIQQQNEIEIKE